MEKGDTLLLAKRLNQDTSFKTKCVYCNLDNHSSSECIKFTTIANRKEMTKKKQLRYNCCKFGHQASKYPFKDCRECDVKRHASICDKINLTKFEEDKLKSLGTFETKSVIHQAVICDVTEVKARALIDTGTGSSYICTYLNKKLNFKTFTQGEKTN